MLNLDKFKEIMCDFTHDEKPTYKIYTTWYHDVIINQNEIKIEFNRNSITTNDGTQYEIPSDVFSNFRQEFKRSHSIVNGGIHIKKEDAFKSQMMEYIDDALNGIMYKLRKKKSLMPKLSINATRSKIGAYLENHQDLVLGLAIRYPEAVQILKDSNSIVKFLKYNNLLVYRM